MKKILLIPLLAMCFAACKKDPEIKGTRDLKNLSLTKLKLFLNGEWRLRRTELYTIAGLQHLIIPDSIKRLLIFYPFDSVKMVSENSVFLREKLVYKYLSLPGMGGVSANVLMFGYDGYDYLNKWVADKLINDTLVFANYFQSEGIDMLYYTKEQ